MFAEYIDAALERAVYKTIEDEDPIFVSVPELPGAWATGKTIEEARKELISVIEGWIALRLRLGFSIPPSYLLFGLMAEGIALSTVFHAPPAFNVPADAWGVRPTGLQQELKDIGVTQKEAPSR
jgi:predicted RNase H-like HicB family nuclease